MISISQLQNDVSGPW